MLCNPALTDRDHSHINIKVRGSEAKPPKYRTHFNKSLDGEIFMLKISLDTPTRKSSILVVSSD